MAAFFLVVASMDPLRMVSGVVVTKPFSTTRAPVHTKLHRHALYLRTTIDFQIYSLDEGDDDVLFQKSRSQS